MTQQPYQEGFQAPQQYQQPVQQQGPPAWAGQPQAQPQQGWGQQSQAPAMQGATNAAAASGGFFGGMGGGGGDPIPSFKWAHVGDVIQGSIVSADVVEVTVYGAAQKTVVVDEKTGEPARQLQVVLQTDLRNWERVAKIPTDDNGNPLPPTADDGKRAIYTGGKSSKGQSWMSGAISDAMAAAGHDPSKGLEVGATLGVFCSEEVPTSYGNPYRKFQAKYARPGQAPQQAPAPQAAAAPQAPAQQQAPQGQDAWQGYQPPADQGQGLPQQPPANPFAQQGGGPAPF